MSMRCLFILPLYQWQILFICCQIFQLHPSTDTAFNIKNQYVSNRYKRRKGSIAADIQWNALTQFSKISQLKCDWHWPLQRSKIKYKYANRKPIQYFLFDGISNVFPICYRLRDIHSWNLHDLEFDLKNGPRLTVNTPLESQ